MLIAPRYLVPDTNCFVDMLASIKSLVQRGEFTVAVPLIGNRQRVRDVGSFEDICAVLQF